MKFTLLPLIGCLCLLVMSCEKLRPMQYSQGTFPDVVTNLGDINSVDDDYNSAIPAFGSVMPLLFSSKRGGRSDFNFVKESLDYSFSRSSGVFSFTNKPYWGLGVLEEQTPIGWAADKVNSIGNELGPYIKSYERDLIKDGMSRHYAEYLMLFASDRTGNLDIYLTHNYKDNPASTYTVTGNTSPISNKTFVDPIPLDFLNSTADDGYPTFDKSNGSIYFTSNRAGTFDIYKATLPTIAPTELQSKLPALSDVAIEKVAELSSTADDKCPFILDNTLVFTSNRPGGLGGYDLYYSKWDGSRWSAPVNFGPTVNTASDEYRPILTSQPDYTNQLMLFSSNRPGGKGGFDLYMVGIQK
ncbi:TolB family protein [Spirosoma fluviale]|uniref:WD40-like Beta Propeller Repeat n=1 Tax=Spirosoma fluviale TaxID=1597977 RepID=A0A286GS47_9BACT|nr:hypothetical protein [Spirosoma fluviale]SOD98391.1 WD40-like Beta Propeller Repeat [Spirosoma fluviale]